MLERASSCFKAGARDSFKCATTKQKTPRSKRQLHLAFWTHGAGDLGVPPHPHALATTPPCDVLLRNDSTTSPRATRSCYQPRLTPTKPVSDGIFLDFLYPPPALAWLNRVNTQPKERWEKRNATRLPEGFIQASRGFSSRSRARPGDAAGYPPSGGEEEVQEGGKDELERLETFGEERTALGNSSPARSSPHNPKDGTLPRKKAEGNSKAQWRDKGDTSFADSPGDLAENVRTPSVSRTSGADYGGSSHDSEVDRTTRQAFLGSLPPHERLQQLRGLLRGKPQNAHPDIVEQIWHLYLSLPVDDRDDLRLKEILLSWLAGTDHHLVPAYSITLIWSMPQEQRKLQTYQSAAQGVLKTASSYELIEALHALAVSHLANVSQFSASIFSEAMQKKAWSLALLVFNSSLSQRQRNQHDLFLVKISEDPNVVQGAERLLQHLAALSDTQRQPWLPVWTYLAKSAAETLLQNRILTDPDKQRTLYSILHHLSLWAPEEVGFFQKLLAYRLQLLYEYLDVPYLRARDTWSSPIISCLYQCFRTMPGAKLDEDSLFILLRLCDYRSRTQHRDISTKRNVSVGTVVNDWQRWHTVVSLDGVRTLLSSAALAGEADNVASWFSYMERTYPQYEDQKFSLWTRVHVRAIVADMASTKQAFEEVQAVAKAHNDSLDLGSWNALILAHERVDDLEGALSSMKSALDAGLTPNRRTVEGILKMLSRRGEVDAVEDVMRQYLDLTGATSSTWLIEAQITALCMARQQARAEEVLTDTVKGHREATVTGPLTGCVNAMLAFYAKMRDIDACMSTYRWMKSEKIRLNGTSYAHLLRVLVSLRQANAAWLIANKVMSEEGEPATALHYAISMQGFIYTQQYDTAINVYRLMLRRNIRPNVDAKQSMVKARLLSEKMKKAAKARRTQTEQESAKQAVRRARGIILKSRDLGASRGSAGDLVGNHYASTIWSNAGPGRLEEAKTLFEDSRQHAEKMGLPWPSFRLYASYMHALLVAKEFEQVEQHWRIIKDHADKMAPPVAVPELSMPGRPSPETSAADEHASQHAYRPNAPIIEPASPDARAELGFAADSTASAPPESGNPIEVLPAKSPAGGKDVSHLGPRPSPGRRHVLTRHFALYIDALRAQGRTADMVREFTRLVTQGYTFDRIVWNRFIEYLCTATDPPLALLAFTLMERYMISNFAGWRTSGNINLRNPGKGERIEGMNNMKERYVPVEKLVPQYRTMLNLGKALIDVRRLDAAGWTPDNLTFNPLASPDADSETQKLQQSLKRFVGTYRLLKEKAPRTVIAVESMPRVDDRWQNRILKGLGWPLGDPRGKKFMDELKVDMEFNVDGSVVPKLLDVDAKGAGDGNGYVPFGGLVDAVPVGEDGIVAELESGKVDGEGGGDDPGQKKGNVS